MVERLESVYKARAQVMSRDECTRLWRPLHGGGMSVVQLSRAPAHSDDVTDYAEAYYIIGIKENDVSRLFEVFTGRPHCSQRRPLY